MRVVQVAKPNAPFEVVERPIPEPGPRHVRIKVEACGICHSDSFTVLGRLARHRLPEGPGS
jgi:D-arabinose 1-dehydrogenase-like Zn-dependent alcohol dehydrogenase